MEMDDLEDMVLTGKVPAGGFLTVDALRDQLRVAQAALARKQGHAGAEQTLT